MSNLENACEIETTINYCHGDKYMAIWTNEPKWRNRLKKLYEQNKETMKGFKCDDDFSSVEALIPVEWLKITPKKKVTMSDERRKELAENLKRAREEAARMRQGEQV